MGYRNSFSQDVILEKSRQIHDRLMVLPDFQAAKRCCGYIELGSEVHLLSFMLSSLKQWSVPYFDSVRGGYALTTLTQETRLVPGPFGTRQPGDKCIEPVEVSDVDLWLVPGVGFDRQGNRLGYGKGIYDRLLSQISGKKIGITYDDCLVDHIPCDPHDIKMDYVVTSSQVVCLL